MINTRIDVVQAIDEHERLMLGAIDEILMDALAAGAEEARTEAVRRVHKISGTLARSIHVQRGENGDLR